MPRKHRQEEQTFVYPYTISAMEGVGGKPHNPANLPLGNWIRTHLTRGWMILGAGQVGKFSSPPCCDAVYRNKTCSEVWKRVRHFGGWISLRSQRMPLVIWSSCIEGAQCMYSTLPCCSTRYGRASKLL